MMPAWVAIPPGDPLVATLGARRVVPPPGPAEPVTPPAPPAPTAEMLAIAAGLLLSAGVLLLVVRHGREGRPS